MNLRMEKSKKQPNSSGYAQISSTTLDNISNTRIPNGSHVRTLALAATLLLLMLVSSETLWRYLGHRPDIADTKMFWSVHRHNVYERAGRRRLVIVGASRAELGIVPGVLQECFPGYEVIALAISDVPPFEIIRDLCQDAKFDGLILCSATVRMLRPATKDRIDKEYIAYYHGEFRTGAVLNKSLNAIIPAWLQSHVVIFSPSLSFKMLLKTRLKPKPLYLHMQYNRYRPAYYRDHMTPEQLSERRRRRIEKHRKSKALLTAASFRQIVQGELSNLYELVRARGGDMVLVRMPTAGEFWTKDESMTPKTEFWDRIEEWSGIPTVHFFDYPELSTFDCPDASHLDATDAPEFTRRLAAIVRRKFQANNTLQPMANR